MDGPESSYLPAAIAEPIKPTAMFDFADSHNPHEPGLKSLGVFVEQNNNLEMKTETPFDSPLFWNDKEGALLDDISHWSSEWSDPKSQPEPTDGTVYTLTVLNPTEQWHKPHEKQKKPENLDLESFLNILPESENDSSSYFYQEYPSFVDPKDLPASPITNNNDWKTNNNNNESLLRNALQGKSDFQRQYGCKKQQRCSNPYPDTSGAHYPVENNNHIDEILGFSENYGDDYEKIKKIASEVDDCAKYGMPLKGEMYPIPLPPADSLLPSSFSSNSVKCFGRKFSKKGISLPGAKASSARKERSLHYCSICAKGFKDKYSVNVHVRTHTGEKPFTCNLCGKSFRQKAHLAKHYQTHLAQTQKSSQNATTTVRPNRPNNR